MAAPFITPAGFSLPRMVRNGALPAGILALIALMVVPIPAVLLDVFFIFNIAISIAIVMVALNAEKPLDFSSFPTVLLLATLLRLALNVASTRVVLVNGHEGTAAAGHVIEAFGAFLIGGNFVVGLFVFAILVIINMIVVTKGAGRVSEVSARFTLDALPGKQMAIDADLNAGLLTPDEAKARRVEVSTEADFYGAMDGSSKFVKGDAVAGLLILFINIIAGFGIGMISHGMSASDAAATYVTLAVGDALVAQLPSLLLSIAAAAIVTRVASTEDLAGQISGQFARSRNWFPVAAILAAMGCIPAMPQMLLIPAAMIAGALAWRLRQAENAPPPAPPPPALPDPSRIAWEDVSDHALVSLELGFGLVHLVDARRGQPLMNRITGVRKQLSQTYGFVVPPIRVRDMLDLPAGRYRITIGGVEAGSADIDPARLLALDTDGLADARGLDGAAARDPSFGLPGQWIAPDRSDLATAQGWLVVDPATVIATHINQALTAALGALFTPDETHALVEQLRTQNAQLVEAVTPSPLSTAQLTRILSELLAEGVPLKNPVPIFSSLARALARTLDHDALVDAVRADIAPLIVGQIAVPGLPLAIVALAGELEALFLRGLAQGEEFLEPSLAEDMASELAAILQAQQAAGPVAVIVQPPLRRPLRRLLLTRLPHVSVLSVRELPATQAIDLIAVIGGQAAPPTAELTDAPTDAPYEGLAT